MVEETTAERIAARGVVMKLDIPEDQFGALVGAAVMQIVTQENRDALIKEAIAHLLAPSEVHSYGARKRSPLQAAFDFAVQERAREFISQTLDEKLKEQVKAVVEEALMKAFDIERRHKLIDNIADAIAKGFAVDRY